MNSTLDIVAPRFDVGVGNRSIWVHLTGANRVSVTYVLDGKVEECQWITTDEFIPEGKKETMNVESPTRPKPESLPLPVRPKAESLPPPEEKRWVSEEKSFLRKMGEWLVKMGFLAVLLPVIGLLTRHVDHESGITWEGISYRVARAHCAMYTWLGASLMYLVQRLKI